MGKGSPQDIKLPVTHGMRWRRRPTGAARSHKWTFDRFKLNVTGTRSVSAAAANTDHKFFSYADLATMGIPGSLMQ